MGRRLSDVYPYLTGVCDLEIESYNAERLCKRRIWFSLPPSESLVVVAEEFVLADFPIIDLSGDHRFVKRLSRMVLKITCYRAFWNKFTYAHQNMQM